MESLAERAVLLADDMRVDFFDEARKSSAVGPDKRWALVVAAFVLGAVVAMIAIAFNLRRATEAQKEIGIASSADPGLSEET